MPFTKKQVYVHDGLTLNIQTEVSLAVCVTLWHIVCGYTIQKETHTHKNNTYSIEKAIHRWM